MLTVYLLSKYTAQLPHSQYAKVAAHCTLSDEKPEVLAAFLLPESAREELKKHGTKVQLYHWHIGSFFSVEEYAVTACSFPELTEEDVRDAQDLVKTVQDFLREYACEQEVCRVSELQLECLQSGYHGSGHIETTEDGTWFWCAPVA